MRSQIPRFALRHSLSITFIVFALCGAGVYAALHMPSALFPQTEFPRVIIMVENGVMPADEMMAAITRPIEEAMKQIPGCQTIRSSTGRGEAEIDLFFSWDVDMRQSELYTLGRIVADSLVAADDGYDRSLSHELFGFPDHRHQPDRDRNGI